MKAGDTIAYIGAKEDLNKGYIVDTVDEIFVTAYLIKEQITERLFFRHLRECRIVLIEKRHMCHGT